MKVRSILGHLGYYSKPYFIIIGAQKTGTSALFNILSQHPQLYAPQEKEIHYFDDGYLKYGNQESYNTKFPLPHQLLPSRFTFEASPSYLYHPECPKRIYDYSPKIKLIVILREPVTRAFSAWQMYRRFRSSDSPHHHLADWRTFEAAIKEEIARIDETSWDTDKIAYVRRGIYHEQLERYYNFFSEESLLILEHSSFTRYFDATLETVCNFLHIDTKFKFTQAKANVGGYNEEMPLEIHEMLSLFYKPYNKKLFTLLKREYDW